MSEARFKTMRHIETFRNYMQMVIVSLMGRMRYHDQSKLESPEVEIFEKITPLLRDVEYGSEEYRAVFKDPEVRAAIEHHYRMNRHHPEYFNGNVSKMDLFDIIEMLVDWKAASLRHDTGDLVKSIHINQERFGFGHELKQILLNTVQTLDKLPVYHKAEES